MDVLEFRNLYWNYYIQLENDFFSYSPYCEIDQCNDNAFSVKYLQLLLSVCGEIDSICKTFCKALDDNFDPKAAGIDNYISILCEKYPTFAEEKVKILNYKYHDVQPWKSTARGFKPNWWQDYNAIKHYRDQERNGKANYKYANQKNAVEALCALYILIEYWAAKIFLPSKKAIPNNQSEVYNPIMGTFQSSRIHLVYWKFYFDLVGGRMGLATNMFYQYLEGGAQP